MKINNQVFSAVAIVTTLTIAPAWADAQRSNVAFNNGIGEKTVNQPANGVQVAYQVTLQGDELYGCSIDIVESLYGRDKGAWGIFDIAGDVKCSSGGFAYTFSSAWDGNGFHASGDIGAGSGSGDFEGIAGRVVQLGGAAADAGDGTLDISYELVIDKASD
ncbi:MAG: hypothetical protein OER96_08020 [Gammaproteobacteria bacterium]|nr:hypothetical protein [Gammaproteobacteria bacterium]